MQQPGTFWTIKGRPCVVTGRGTKTVKQPGWKQALTWNYNTVVFLDGDTPFTQDVSEGKFKAAKPFRAGPQLDHFKRIYELKGQGLMIQAAVLQARAELAKGVGRSDVIEANG